MHVAVGRSTIEIAATFLLLLPSYQCCNCRRLLVLNDDVKPLVLNDDVDNRHRKSQEKKQDLRNLRERMFNHLSLGFEEVEDQRREVVVKALNNWVTWNSIDVFFYLLTNNPQAGC